MGMEISKTFPDTRGSMKWAEMYEINTKQFQNAKKKRRIIVSLLIYMDVLFCKN